MVFSAVANYWSEVCSVLEFSTWPPAEANGIPRRMAVGNPRIACLLRAWRMVVWVEAGESSRQGCLQDRIKKFLYFSISRKYLVHLRS